MIITDGDNDILETSTVTTTVSDTLSLTETGSFDGGTYSLVESDTSSATTVATDNAITGDYTTQYDDSNQSSAVEHGSLGGGSYTLTKTVQSGNHWLTSGNSLSGDYTTGTTATSTTTSQETNTDSLTASFTEIENLTTVTDETGNDISGDYARSQSRTDILSDYDAYNIGNSLAVAVTESSTTVLSITETGNTISGDYTRTTTADSTYSMTETVGVIGNLGGLGGIGGPTTWSPGQFSLNQTGSLTATTSEIGSTVTGLYTRTETADDTYTMNEIGGNSGGQFTETVTGSDTATLTETGNMVNQWYTRTITGTDSYTRSDGGAGATLSSGSGTVTYTLTEYSDARAGILNQSETGTDRYGLLERYVDIANSQGGSKPGNMDYWPFGQPWVDPGYAEAFWQAMSTEARILLRSSDWQVHHTHFQQLAPVWEANGIDMHAVDTLRAVRPRVHQEITEAQTQWIAGEMRQIDPNWTWNNPEHRAAFLARVRNDPAFFDRLRAFQAGMQQEYGNYWVRATDSTSRAREVHRRVDGRTRLRRFSLGQGNRFIRLLPRLAGALAIFALFTDNATFAANLASHTPEQEDKWRIFETRYRAALERAIETGQMPERRHLDLLIDALADYLQAMEAPETPRHAIIAALRLYIADR
jgi:hypothetical protein